LYEGLLKRIDDFMIKQFIKLFKHEGFMRYFKNVSWLFFEKIVRIFEGLFVGIWVARYLGPEQFGLFNYANSVIYIFMVIAALGLDNITVRELVRDESRRNVLMGSVFVLKLIGAICILPLLGLALRFMHNDWYLNFLVFIMAGGVVLKSFNVIDCYFQSRVLSKYSAWANTITLAISGMLKILFILMRAPLISFVVLVVVDAMVLALGFVYFYRKISRDKIRSWRFEWQTAKKILNDGWPVVLSGAAMSVYMRVDQIMIKEMINAEAVGQYAAAVRLSEGWYFIPMAIVASVFPAILNAKKMGKDIYYARLQKLYNLMAYLGMAIGVPVIFLSDWLINFLYGSEYAQAGGVLVIHVWAGLFYSFGLVTWKWFFAENYQLLGSLRSVYGMVFNILLNLIVIPTHGLRGAAFATLLAHFLAFFVLDFFDPKTKPLFFMKLKAVFCPASNLINWQREVA